MTKTISKSQRSLSFEYDGANRRVYKEYSYYVKDNVPIESRGSNPEVKQKYQKGVSKEPIMIDRYSGYTPEQTTSKMIGKGHWEYESTFTFNSQLL